MKTAFHRRKWIRQRNAQGTGPVGFPPPYCLSCKIATPVPCSDSGRRPFSPQRCLLQLCADSLDKADQHRFTTVKGELLPDWGREMRKFTLSLMHAFGFAGGRNALPGKGAFRALLFIVGMALPLAGRSDLRSNSCWSRFGWARPRNEEFSPSVALSPELIDPRSNRLSPPASAIYCARIATGHTEAT